MKKNIKNITMDVISASINAHGVVKSVFVLYAYIVSTDTRPIIAKPLPRVMRAAMTTTAPPLESATIAAIKLTI